MEDIARSSIITVLSSHTNYKTLVINHITVSARILSQFAYEVITVLLVNCGFAMKMIHAYMSVEIRNNKDSQVLFFYYSNMTKYCSLTTIGSITLFFHKFASVNGAPLFKHGMHKIYHQRVPSGMHIYGFGMQRFLAQ